MKNISGTMSSASTRKNVPFERMTDVSDETYSETFSTISSVKASRWKNAGRSGCTLSLYTSTSVASFTLTFWSTPVIWRVELRNRKITAKIQKATSAYPYTCCFQRERWYRATLLR